MSATCSDHGTVHSVGMEDIFGAFARGSASVKVKTLPVPENESAELKRAADVWAAVCRMAEETLLKRQSLVIPGFATIGIQKATESMGGIWRDRETFYPCFFLAPTFVAQYCSDRVGYHAPSPLKHGGSVPVLLNGATLSDYASGTPRHVALNTVKDLVRIIGLHLLDGHPKTGKKVPVRVEMGFLTIEFTTPTVRTQWSRAFLDELANAIKQVSEASTPMQTSTTDKLPFCRPRTASHVKGDSEKQSARGKIPAPPSARVGQERGLAVSGPRPPSRAKIADTSASDFASSGPHTSERQGHATLPSPPVSRSNSVCSSKLSENTSPRPQTALSAFTSYSPRNREQFLASVEAITKASLSSFEKAKARKAAFRRLRGAAFGETWDAQIRDREEKRSLQREEEYRRVESLKQTIAEELTKEQNERIARRREEQQTLEINKALSARRKEQSIPKWTEGSGGLFDERLTPTHRRDGEELRRQIAEREEKRKREKESDLVYSQYIVDQDKAWNDKLMADRRNRRLQQQSLKEDYDKQLEAKSLSRAEHRTKASLSQTSGGLFFSGNETSADEQRELRQIKLRAREYQLENKFAAEERERDARARAADMDYQNRAIRRSEHEELKRIACEQRQASRNRQKVLSDTLERQISDKRQFKEKERADQRNYSPRCFLKNESSDDEE